MAKKGTIRYSVHPTPKKPGDSQQTYHVRIERPYIVSTDELRAHIASHAGISEGQYELVMKTLRDELLEHLCEGKGVHIDGLGMFSLQLGTVKVADGEGGRSRRSYLSPRQLKASEVTVDGISFLPDRQLTRELRAAKFTFQRRKDEPVHDVPRAELLKGLAGLCAEYGSFTRHDVQRLFGITRYLADRLLTELVVEANPMFCRTKAGTTWVYRKTGA
ncbi:MAG: HU family DNA-binding protein [Prevotella sp.]|nr:HU family DNA-binding protein [Prevotella sp.]